MERSRIIDVTRKPSRCPVCGEEVVDIIYGTGDMTEIEFLYEYRKSAIMGGDNIPRRPPIWACSYGCKRFRKVNPDGSDAPLAIKLLKNVRRGPISKLYVQSELVPTLPREDVHFYQIKITTEHGETPVLNVICRDAGDARGTIDRLLQTRMIGLKGRKCTRTDIISKDGYYFDTDEPIPYDDSPGKIFFYVSHLESYLDRDNW